MQLKASYAKLSKSYIIYLSHLLQTPHLSLKILNSNLNPQLHNIQTLTYKQQFKPKNKILELLLNSSERNQMLSSSPAFLKCYECKKSPKQFTFLQCNHIICEKCISKKIEFGQKCNSVMCACGSLTYFNEDSEVVQEEDFGSCERRQELIGFESHINDQNNKSKKDLLAKVGFSNSNQSRNSLTNHNPRSSFSKNLSKQTIDQYSKTLINERSTMPMLQASEVFSLQKHDSSQQLQNAYQASSPQKHKHLQGSLLTTQMRNHLTATDKTNKYDESLLLDNYHAYEFGGRKERVINQFSTMEVGGNSEKKDSRKDKGIKCHSPNNNVLNNVKTVKESVVVDSTQNDKNRANGIVVTNVKQSLFPQPKQLPNNPSTTSLSSFKPANNHHSHFQSQLSFLKILFQKDTQQIAYQFKKVIESITKAYNQLEEQLRALYVQEVITKESLMSFNLSDMIKHKYDHEIGGKFRWVKEKLFAGFYEQVKDKQSQNSRKDIKHKLNYQKATTNLIQHLKPLIINKSSKINYSLNHSSPLSDSNETSHQSQQLTTTNHHKLAPRFDTIQQKLQRLTTKPYKMAATKGLTNNKALMDHVKQYNDESKKRIQTQNIHTSIKRNHSHDVLNRHHDHRHKLIPNNIQKDLNKTTNYHKILSPHQTNTASPQYRLTQKPAQKSYNILPAHQNQTPKHQTVYYSPPIPYCYKHLQKRQKQAREYISYIERLCHQKKMKNSQELFKKGKIGHNFDVMRRQQETGMKGRS